MTVKSFGRALLELVCVALFVFSIMVWLAIFHIGP
jgi:hypothetical protein